MWVLGTQPMSFTIATSVLNYCAISSVHKISVSNPYVSYPCGLPMLGDGLKTEWGILSGFFEDLDWQKGKPLSLPLEPHLAIVSVALWEICLLIMMGNLPSISLDLKLLCSLRSWDV